MRTGVRVALDVGSARIGVAACDPAATLSFGIDTVRRGAGDLDRLVDLIREREAVEVVVGWPLRLDGTPGPAAESVREFAERLSVRLSPLVVRMVDERLTTAAAQRGLHEAGRTIRSSRAIIDEQAAVQLLDDALALERASGSAPGFVLDLQASDHLEADR
jgi:putative Holliday junction resolvase